MTVGRPALWSSMVALALGACSDESLGDGGDASATAGSTVGATAASTQADGGPGGSDDTGGFDGIGDYDVSVPDCAQRGCPAGSYCDLDGTCQPGCASDADCPDPTICDTATATCVCDPTAGFCVADLPPGHWVEIADSSLAAVTPESPPPGSTAAIMSAWSGGAADTLRDRLVVWGGGHSDYSGNEVYVFDLAALAWSRLDEPSSDVGGDEATGYYPDAKPRSRHTYDYVEYIPPPVDLFCSFGGAGLYPSGQIGVDNTDCYDFDTLTWSARANATSGGIGSLSGYDPETGYVFVVGTGGGQFLSGYDPAGDAWEPHGDQFTSGGIGNSFTAAVDPVARLLVAVGGGQVYTWPIDAAGAAPEQSLPTDGAPAELQVNNPGFAWDPDLARLVMWGGGASLWALDPVAAEWSELAPAPDNAIVPTAPATNGTYGRFGYFPSFGVYAVVNAIDENVFLYRAAPP